MGHAVDDSVGNAYRSNERAEEYATRRRARRLGELWEHRVWRRVLRRIGRQDTVLDVPGGTGRFWPTLDPFAGDLHTADAAGAMLRAGRREHPGIRLASLVVASADALPYRDASFDLVVCSRLLHHFADPDDRIAILTELSRVSSSWVAYSTWTTGNWKERRHATRQQRRERPQRRFFIPLETAAEEAAAAGLEVVAVDRKLRGISPLTILTARKRD